MKRLERKSEPVSASRSLKQGTTGVASKASCLSVDHRIDWWFIIHVPLLLVKVFINRIVKKKTELWTFQKTRSRQRQAAAKYQGHGLSSKVVYGSI